MVQSIYQQELRDRQALAEERRNQQERDDVARVVGGLGGVVITPQTAIAEERERDNTLALIAGIHGGATITKPNTTIIGHPGAITNRLWTINTVNQVTRIQGVHFRCLDPKANNAVALVNIMAVSTVLFTACTFELGGGHYGSYGGYGSYSKGHLQRLHLRRHTNSRQSCSQCWGHW